MPVGAAQAAFREAAASDGIQLEVAKVSWINQRGHLALPKVAAEIAGPALEAIFLALEGQTAAQLGKRVVALPGDFYHAPTGTFIETDEMQHFTSFRLRTLELYPLGVPLGFDISFFKHLCRQWAPTADKYRAAKDATGFGPGGRQRQRAYNDSLRDLVIPAMGHPPVIRIPILNDNGAAAYLSHREMLLLPMSP
ncbi:hypothetical protein HWD94_11615 [Pseudarthrobacter equi]|uniref:hypothetical protein n=1 Tax=Pseudarthrobacter equi TaxID=728066 RepID=UPI0021C20346|nr:hypothetical protein [Pseudarthrobacter equi]MCT9625770.1 hypothetical protein [Pseudarthrobacter equi]